MKLYKRVKLLTNKFNISDSLPFGAIGYVIEIYEGGFCEVEFSDNKTGISYAQVVIHSDFLEQLD